RVAAACAKHDSQHDAPHSTERRGSRQDRRLSMAQRRLCKKTPVSSTKILYFPYSKPTSAGTISKAHPRAAATRTSVSSCGTAFLLSSLAITLWVSEAACASSFCVIPWSCLRAMSRSMIAAHCSDIVHTPHWNTVDIAAIRAQIDLVAPDLLAVHTRIDVPRHTMLPIQINAPEVFQL